MSHKRIATIENVPVYQDADLRVHYVAKGAIDADGAYKAYHPDNRSGLDDLRNAGHPGNWWGIVTDNGTPVVQRSTDPAPGFYVSATAYEWPGHSKFDPRRYVDAEGVPYVVVSPVVRNAARGVVLGCKARITNTRNGRHVEAVVADIGPIRKIGEMSIAAAKALGIPSSPRTGGTDEKILAYELFPGTPAVVNGVEYRLIPA